MTAIYRDRRHNRTGTEFVKKTVLRFATVIWAVLLAIATASAAPPGRGAALNAAGRDHVYSGDYTQAAQAFLAAIDAFAAAGDHEGIAEARTNLGNAYFYVGRYADAVAEYDAALAVIEQHRNESWVGRRRRVVQVNRAVLYQRLGRDEQALEIYDDLGSGAGDLPLREQAQVVANRGVLFRHLGDPHKAIAAYDEALALFARDPLPAGELNVMKNRGIALALDLGELEAARQTFSASLAKARAAGNRREIVQAQLYRAETELRAGLVEAARIDFSASLAAARATGTPEDEWKAFFGLGRTELATGKRLQAAIEFERAIAVIEGIRDAIRIPMLRSDFFSDKREVYDAFLATIVDTAPVERLFNVIERSHSRAWRERLGLSGSVDLNAVQQTLASDVALLDLWDSPMGSAAVLVTHHRADVIRVQLDSKAVERFVDAVSAGESAASLAYARQISAGLPFTLPNGTRHLIVVPDGALALVPFELLPRGNQLLVEQVAVSYAPTAALLLRADATRPRFVPPWSVQLRAFGDPLVNTAPLDDVSQLRGRLTASVTEVEGVARELAGGERLHLGRDNRKAYLFDQEPVAPVLHIATHAVSDANAMEQSRILFSPAREGGGADYLFLKEAYDLKLDGVDLAVLSACETERGRVLRGEGVQSFSRALLAAGARSTVTTLWRVPDAPTADFMKIFYYHLQRGESRDEALRLAKLRFLRSGSTLSDPHYWAAFVLTGDAIRPIPRATTWTTIGLVVGVAVGVLVAGVAAAHAWQRARLRRRQSSVSGLSA